MRIRYDGLYKIIAAPEAVTFQTDALGKRDFLKYVLRREDGQIPLMDIVRKRPSAEEKGLYYQYTRLHDSVTR